MADELKHKVREADAVAVEYAAVVFEKIAAAFDIEKRREDIPFSRWWWWLDKVASGEIEPDLNDI